MDKDTWRWALTTQMVGLCIAMVGLGGYWQTVEDVNGWSIFFTILVPAVITAVALVWDIFGEPDWRILRLKFTRLRFSVTVAYTNMACLGLVLYWSGGAVGILTPIYLLVPHTTAAFLRKTDFATSAWPITLLIILIYTINHFLAPPPIIKDPVGYSSILILVLAGTIVLTVCLEAFGPRGKVETTVMS